VGDSASHLTWWKKHRNLQCTCKYLGMLGSLLCVDCVLSNSVVQGKVQDAQELTMSQGFEEWIVTYMSICLTQSHIWSSCPRKTTLEATEASCILPYTTSWLGCPQPQIDNLLRRNLAISRTVQKLVSSHILMSQMPIRSFICSCTNRALHSSIYAGHYLRVASL
jgi:hypothetical protein